MIYTSFSLNGTWDMYYTFDKYNFVEAPEFPQNPIENAVLSQQEDVSIWQVTTSWVLLTHTGIHSAMMLV